MAQKKVTKVVSFRIPEKDHKELNTLLKILKFSKSQFLRDLVSNILLTTKE